MSDNSSYVHFIEIWSIVMIYGTIALLIIGLVLAIVHNIKISSIKDFKQKYEYINKNEINRYKSIYILLGIAVAFFSNTYDNETVMLSYVWFFVRFFIAMCVGTLVGYVSILIVKYYYPGKMQKKLDKWRYMPRINPKTGNKMKLLSEEEEDVHLDEGMQAEENVFSVDYDVWIDEQTNDVKIEKYEGYMKALVCGSCGFQTLKIKNEEIIEPATEDNEGELLKHYECAYCKSVRTTAHIISRLANNDNEEYIRNKVMAGKVNTIAGVKVQIISADGNIETFDFQKVDQAENFLREYK
ncbi:MAG: hypothetical protein OEW67_01085 [Cyclobacteriaceae bacterium]|nr:hypothetical protein [Cyclobacteriaceae bacterium]